VSLDFATECDLPSGADTYDIAMSVVSLATDVLIVILPASFFWKLKMSVRRRLGLIAFHDGWHVIRSRLLQTVLYVLL
jgi:hypothetical protein